jgi:hypothetical protein
MDDPRFVSAIYLGDSQLKVQILRRSVHGLPTGRPPAVKRDFRASWYTPDVFTLRCTSRLLKRLNVACDAATLPPTTRLGDWYGKVVQVQRQQVVLCVSEKTLVPVVLPASPIGTVAARLRTGVVEVLQRLGIDEEVVVEESAAMAEVSFGKTANRSVLGSTNDFSRMLDAYVGEEASLVDIAVELTDTPCGPLGMETPRRVTERLFLGVSTKLRA